MELIGINLIYGSNTYESRLNPGKNPHSPENTTDRDDHWKAFRICGVLDFSLIGILAGIASVLASERIGIFAISTYNTDYILTKEENFKMAIQALKEAGYRVLRKDE